MSKDGLERTVAVQGFADGIPWPMHVTAWNEHAKKFGRFPDAEEIAGRGGFGVGELDGLIPGWREELRERSKPVVTPPLASVIDQHRFFNACMSLMNIDMHELVEAGIIAPGNLDSGGSSYQRFTRDPLIFIAKIDDRKREALWNILEKRQRTPAARVRYALAPSHPADRASLPKALYETGDVRLVWVNEGDLLLVGREIV